MTDKAINMTCPKCKGQFVVYEQFLPQAGMFRCPYCSQMLRRAGRPVQPAQPVQAAQSVQPVQAAPTPVVPKPSPAFFQQAAKKLKEKQQQAAQQVVVAQPVTPAMQAAAAPAAVASAASQAAAKPANNDPNPTVFGAQGAVKQGAAAQPKPSGGGETVMGGMQTPPGMAGTRPVLVVAGRNYPLNVGRNVVGRQAGMSGATLQLPVADQYMSRQNAIINITPSAGGALLATIESVNPKNLVKYYGQPLAMGVKSQLYPGTPFMLGHTQVTYKLV